MTRRLWYLIALLAVLTLYQSSEAQLPIPTWKNDAQGRPAPPCMVLDAASGISLPCSTSNPLPIGGGATGQGTTSGTSETGFGKEWYPSNFTRTLAAGEPFALLFIDDINVAAFYRSTGCGSCLRVALSSDGGINFTDFSTSFNLGNNLTVAFRVPSSPTRYLIGDIGSPSFAAQSTSLLSGWTDIPAITSAPLGFASKPDGSRVLSIESNARVCISTNTGVSFGSCAIWGTGAIAATAGKGIAYAGGTNWIFVNDVPSQVWRSTDDGVTFTQVATLTGQGRSVICLAPGYTNCLATDTAGNVSQSTDAGLTWIVRLSGVGSAAGLADYGNGNAGVLSQSPPIGLVQITQSAWSSFNNGLAWFAGTVNGSRWDGTGTINLKSFDARSGRGVASYSASSGGGNQLSIYNPLTAPGGTLSSSAGGYNIAALIQSGLILNTTPVTSAATTAAVLTLTNTPGSRICLRNLALITSSATQNITLTVTDGATVVLNLGTVSTGAVAGNPTVFTGSPLVCSQTNNNLVVNIGAAGAGTTTTSAIADRYPN